MTAVNNENINTSPRATARSRQQSTNSLFAKASASPSKRALYTFDGPSKASAKSGSPRGDAAGAPEWHLRSTASRSSPLAPLGANTQAAHRQSAQDKVNLSTPSPLSVLPGPASKADGLRLHWDEVVPSIASQGATTPSQSSSTRSSYEQDSQSRHQLAFLSAQDLSIPDLQDADISPLDSHFLLSPFTMSEPNFNKPAGRVSSSDEKPSPSLIASQVPSPATLLPQSVNNATPTSPPRQAFFQSGSAGSFSRFPTPDKLAMGFTPSPVQQSNLSPTGLLLPPISPSGPILAADSSLLRSTSSQTIQSDSSSSSSLNTSSSASRLSDIDKSDLPSTEQKQPSEHVAKRSGSKSRGGLSRSDIRESLLSFPSPPTSPRLFTFGRAAGTVLSASNAREAASLSGRNAPTSDILHAGIVQEEDDLQSSIDELLAGTGAGVNSLLPSPLNFPVSSSSSASMSPGALPSAHAPRSLASASLPPNMALPPLPPISKLSLEQGDSPSQETPGSGDVSLAASYIRPILPLRTPQMTAAPVFENKPVGLEPDSSSSQLAASESATIPSKASHSPSTAPPRPLRPSKSTESLLASRTHQMTSTSKTAMPTPVSHTDTPKQSRRRRASLSIKIPKMFTKTRKAEEDLLPQSAISQNSLQIPQSRFSPDSDGPTPISEKSPANIFKKLSRAASSPNLKAVAAMATEGGVVRQSSRKAHFVAPASAPPVPTTYVAPLQADTSSGTPLPTPSLVTDIDSSMGGDSPRPGGSAEHESTFARMQSYNPYFPKFPPRQSSLVLSSTGLQDSRSPQSPQDMDWLHSPPHATSSKIASPLNISTLQAKPMIALATSDSCYSDSGSASMPSEEAKRPKKTSASVRPTGTRRSTLSGSSNGDEEEDEEDAYGGQSLSSDEYYTSSEEEDDEESEDDDVPLAETHPDALDVQKSLRAKVKRDQGKKKKRNDKIAQSNIKAGRESQIPVRELQSSSIGPSDQALSRKATLTESAVPQVKKRNPFGFAPDELSEKLRHLDASHGRLNSLRHPPKRPDSAGERPHDLLLPQTDEHVKHRSSVKGRTNLAPPLAPFVQDSVLTMSEGSDNEDVAPLRIKKKSQPLTLPTSHAMARQASSEASSIPASPRSPSIKQHDQSFSALHEATASHRFAPPMHHHHGRPAFSSRQRVYINDPQHHCNVDVDENMTAAMLLSHLRAKGAVSSNPAWTVTEVWRVMGVERPLREYELLQESIESWSTEANSSLLLVKKSPLAPLLSNLSKIRSDSETTSGWVYLEVKHGKWSKRYIEVRSGAMYIGKSEKQRDLALLCHFSNFDAYIVPQACLAKMKTPKPFAFAVKSVDKVSLFENADQDYIHFFSVKTEAERDMWIQHILESRSKLVKQIGASRQAALAPDTRSNLMGQQMAQHHQHAMPQNLQHHSMPMNTSSAVSRSASSKSHTPPMPSQAGFGDQSQLARRPSNAHPMPMEAKKIISADNLPPLPGAIPSGTFGTLPQGRQWERLAPEDKRAMIHEASRKARDGGKALLDFGEKQESAGLLGRARAKSVGQRR